MPLKQQKGGARFVQEAATGRVNRAVRALQLVTGIRADHARRADRFVELWRELGQNSQRLNQMGDMSGYKATRAVMSDMAKSLERDPQLEAILANRKRDFGIEIEVCPCLRQLNCTRLASSSAAKARDVATIIGLNCGHGLGLNPPRTQISRRWTPLVSYRRYIQEIL